MPYLAPPPPLLPHVSPTATAPCTEPCFFPACVAPPGVGFHPLRLQTSLAQPSPFLTTWATHPSLVFSCHARQASSTRKNDVEHSLSSLCFLVLVLRSNTTLRNPFRITRVRLYIEGPFIPFGCCTVQCATQALYSFIWKVDCSQRLTTMSGGIRSRLPPAQYLDLSTLSSAPLRGA